MPPSPDNSPLSECLYAFELRDPTAAAPAWQRKLHEEIRTLYGFVLNVDFTDIEDKKDRLKWLTNVYRYACVQLSATPKAPQAADNVANQLEDYRKRLWGDLFADIQSKVNWHRYWIIGAGALLLAAALVLRSGVSALGLPESPAVGNYVLVTVGAMAGLFASDWRLKQSTGPEDYDAVRLRFLHPPFVRVLATAFVAVAVGLAVSSEVVKITLGKLSSSDLPNNAAIALIIGFLAGIPGSFVIKRLWRWVGGDESEKSERGRAGRR